MRTLVESLKRLYSQGKVTREHIDEMYQNGKLTTEEYWYIISEPNK